MRDRASLARGTVLTEAVGIRGHGSTPAPPISRTDPLCCPSRRTLVRYRIDRSQRAPLVTPVSASASAAGS